MTEESRPQLPQCGGRFHREADGSIVPSGATDTASGAASGRHPRPRKRRMKSPENAALKPAEAPVETELKET